MRYIPSYELNIIAEEQFSDAIADVEAQLEKVKHSGNFVTFDSLKMYYEYFLAENSRGNIVIVHGLSEFTKKFYEFIYYALNQGYNVFIYDQRCHGLSDRLTKFKDLLHVDDFFDYEKDLEYFIDEIVLKTEDKPLYLYAHSMGGAVAALYLAKNNQKIKKAILSAPMLEPVVKEVPAFLARASVQLGKVFLGPKHKFFLSKEFDPNVAFNYAYGLSKARFDFNMKMRRENPNYQSTPMSYGWVSNSLTIGKKILNPKIINKIVTPILIISARDDKVVKNDVQKEFFEKCKSCRFESIEYATHAILASHEKILLESLTLTFDFMAS